MTTSSSLVMQHMPWYVFKSSKVWVLFIYALVKLYFISFSETENKCLAYSVREVPLGKEKEIVRASIVLWWLLYSGVVLNLLRACWSKQQHFIYAGAKTSQTYSQDWLCSFWIQLSSFQLMARAAMLPLRTVSSSIKYLLISPHLVQSLEFYSYSTPLSYICWSSFLPLHWVENCLNETNERRFWFDNRHKI